MAKFCGNCGAPMADNERVCGQCGYPVDMSPKSSPVKIVDPEKKKKRKKLIQLVVLLVLVVVVVATVINVITKFTGCNGLVRKVMAAYEEYDIESLISLSSDIYFYGSEDYPEYYFENAVGTTLDYFESSVGHNYRLTYEINETYQMSERRTNETLEEIEYSYSDFDVSIIEEIVVADISVTASQDSSTTVRDVDIIMSKEDGDWKLLFIE